jgi:hypothetical protein
VLDEPDRGQLTLLPRKSSSSPSTWTILQPGISLVWVRVWCESDDMRTRCWSLRHSSAEPERGNSTPCLLRRLSRSEPKAHDCLRSRVRELSHCLAFECRSLAEPTAPSLETVSHCFLLRGLKKLEMCLFAHMTNTPRGTPFELCRMGNDTAFR